MKTEGFVYRLPVLPEDFETDTGLEIFRYYVVDYLSSYFKTPLTSSGKLWMLKPYDEVSTVFQQQMDFLFASF